MFKSSDKVKIVIDDRLKDVHLSKDIFDDLYGEGEDVYGVIEAPTDFKYSDVRGAPVYEVNIGDEEFDFAEYNLELFKAGVV